MEKMELLAILVSLCLVSSGLSLHGPVDAVPVYDSGVRYGPLDASALYDVDEYGDQDDYDIVDYSNEANQRDGFGIRHRPYDVRYGRMDASVATYNVVDFGAKGNGGGDDSQAFARAWQAACKGGGSSGGSPTFYVPSGKTFALSPTVFPGPCKPNSIKVQIDGVLVAPRSMSGWKSCPLYSWLLFVDISNLNVYGSGLIDGQGSIWWRNQFPQGYQITGCYGRPTALKFHNCQNLALSGLRLLDSPRNHLGINMCDKATISYLQMVAPEASPNTDGINIMASRDIKIHDLSIQTGDDCIAINGNTSRVTIMNIKCGPGHGISIGSLGAQGTAAFVEDIYVGKCTFVGSQNGVRIKTWQGGSGAVNNVVFEDITLVRTKNPIVIDQFYCNGQKDCGTSTRNLKISNVKYNRIRGTTASEDAVMFNCASIGCTGIVMNQVDIRPADPNKPVTAVCRNARLSYEAATSPRVPC